MILSSSIPLVYLLLFIRLASVVAVPSVFDSAAAALTQRCVRVDDLGLWSIGTAETDDRMKMCPADLQLVPRLRACAAAGQRGSQPRRQRPARRAGIDQAEFFGLDIAECGGAQQTDASASVARSRDDRLQPSATMSDSKNATRSSATQCLRSDDVRAKDSMTENSMATELQLVVAKRPSKNQERANTNGAWLLLTVLMKIYLSILLVDLARHAIVFSPHADVSQWADVW